MPSFCPVLSLREEQHYLDRSVLLPAAYMSPVFGMVIVLSTVINAPLPVPAATQELGWLLELFAASA